MQVQVLVQVHAGSGSGTGSGTGSVVIPVNENRLIWKDHSNQKPPLFFLICYL